MDRRLQKSKEAIMNAFVDLLAEKDFEKITINEIASKANVSRGTVYLHYVDKHDLLKVCVDISLTNLEKHCIENSINDGPTVDSAKASMLSTFEYMEQHSFLYRTLFMSSENLIFRNELRNMMAKSFEMKIESTNQGIPKEVFVQFMVSASVGIVEWWIVNRTPYTSKEITEHLWKILERNQLIPNEFDINTLYN